MSALLEVQQALYRACTESEALMGKIAGAYDHIPTDSALPYIVIGEGSETPLNTFEQQDWEVQATIRIFSAEQSYTEAYDILQSLYEALRNVDVSMEHFELVTLDYQSGAAIVEEEDEFRQVQAVYRMIVHRSTDQS